MRIDFFGVTGFAARNKNLVYVNKSKQTNKKQNKARKLKLCLLKKNNQNNKNMELMMTPRDSNSWCLIFIRIFLLRELSISDGSVRQWRGMRKIRGGKNKH